MLVHIFSKEEASRSTQRTPRERKSVRSERVEGVLGF